MNPLLGVAGVFVVFELLFTVFWYVVGLLAGSPGMTAKATTFFIAAVALGVVTVVLAAGDATPTRMGRW